MKIRRAYLTIIGSSHGAQNQLLVGMIELNNAHSSNFQIGFNNIFFQLLTG
jgi:hypothetical protein